MVSSQDLKTRVSQSDVTTSLQRKAFGDYLISKMNERLWRLLFARNLARPIIKQLETDEIHSESTTVFEPALNRFDLKKVVVWRTQRR